MNPSPTDPIPLSASFEEFEQVFWRCEIAKHGRVPGEVVADILRRAMRSEVPAKSDRPGTTWDSVYIGHFLLRIEGHLIVIFNDADEVDYVECVEWSDGRLGHFDDWSEKNEQPFDLLNETEWDFFQKWIRTVA